MERPEPTMEEKKKYMWKCAVILMVIVAAFFYFALQIPPNWPVLIILAVFGTVVMGFALRFVLRKTHK
ncbi:hypothetical protein [Amycolatopsis circi]|uniref:hypothetical protein n=1 Tax=Amycolatopsis circi TaxID=871959 RepID=UPI0013BE9D57|nr:hypothetical protein [Amycolatopsis circi]